MNLRGSLKDTVTGSLILFVCFLIYVVVIPREVEQKIQRGLASDFFPKLSVAWTGIFAGLLVCKSIFGRKKYSEEEVASEKDKHVFLWMISTILIVVLYLVLCPLIGYIASTVLALISLMCIFGERRLLVLLLTSVVLSFVIYAVFGLLVNVDFP